MSHIVSQKELEMPHIIEEENYHAKKKINTLKVGNNAITYPCNYL